MARRLKLVRFPKPKVSDDTQFIETLVWVLAQARAGKVRGYATVFVVETHEGAERTIEAAKAFEGVDKHHILGGMRRMEANYMRREWPEDAS